MKKAIILLAVVWLSKSFFFVDDMVVFLNAMPKDKQHDAKITLLSKLRTQKTVYNLSYRK